jgi:catechol 2,3-dioxygenase-like lactoylglutathione lyase family enzyme
MTITMDLVGITVADMAKSLAFYRLLGLDIPADADSEPHVDITLPSGVRMAWDTVDTIRSFDPEWAAAQGSPRVSLAFLCGSPAEVDEQYAALIAAGYDGHKEPWDAFWGQRYALVRDPDGNGIDLFAPLG